MEVEGLKGLGGGEGEGNCLRGGCFSRGSSFLLLGSFAFAKSKVESVLAAAQSFLSRRDINFI